MEFGIYEHYKAGGLYLATATGTFTGNGELNGETCVIYFALYDDSLPKHMPRFRPLREWEELVDWPSGVGLQPRFRYCPDYDLTTRLPGITADSLRKK